MSAANVGPLPLPELRLALTILLTSMVDDPSSIDIVVKDLGRGSHVFEVRVAESDRGKIIGANGRTARSLRVLLLAAGKKYGATLTLDIDG